MALFGQAARHTPQPKHFLELRYIPLEQWMFKQRPAKSFLAVKNQLSSPIGTFAYETTSIAQKKKRMVEPFFNPI